MNSALCGVVYCGDDDEYEYERTSRQALWQWRRFHSRFWAERYRRKIELKLDADGKPIYDEDAWGMSIETQKEIDEWKYPTPEDIIEVVAFLCLRQIDYKNQYYADKFPWRAVNNWGDDTGRYRECRYKYEYKEERHWCWLRIPMNEMLTMNGVQFDGKTFTVGAKKYDLVTVMQRVSVECAEFL